MEKCSYRKKIIISLIIFTYIIFTYVISTQTKNQSIPSMSKVPFCSLLVTYHLLPLAGNYYSNY